MTDTEIIQKFQETGAPIRTGSSMPSFPNKPGPCLCLRPRCVACDFDSDLKECQDCGAQWVTKCTFDEDMS